MFEMLANALDSYDRWLCRRRGHLWVFDFDHDDCSRCGKRRDWKAGQ